MLRPRRPWKVNSTFLGGQSPIPRGVLALGLLKKHRVWLKGNLKSCQTLNIKAGHICQVLHRRSLPSTVLFFFLNFFESSGMLYCSASFWLLTQKLSRTNLTKDFCARILRGRMYTTFAGGRPEFVAEILQWASEEYCYQWAVSRSCKKPYKLRNCKESIQKIEWVGARN